MEINDDIIKCLKKGVYKAYKRREIPVCAVIVDSKGNIVSSAFNCRQKSYDVLGHAEILAIKKAEKKIKDWRLNGYSMFVSLEPCFMCSAIIKECRLDQVFYFLPKKIEEISEFNITNKNSIEGYDDLKRYFNDLLINFFDNKR